MITWNITPAVSQYNNSPITVVINGVAPLERLVVFVSTPEGDTFRWKLQANELGKLSDQLFLASGPGRYLFEIEGCKDLPPVSIVAGCCAPEDSVCGLELFVDRTNLQLGGKVEVDVIGATPWGNVYFYQQFGLSTVPTAVKADADGRANLSATLSEAGTYSFFATQEDCVAEAKLATVIGNVNELPTEQVDSCAGKVTVTPQFLVAGASNSANIAMLLTVVNGGVEPTRVSLDVPLPAGLTGTPSVTLVDEPIPALSSRDFTFFLDTNNPTEKAMQVVVAVLGSHGTYTCDNSNYPIKGSTAVLNINPSPIACGVEVTQVAFNLTNVAKGQSAIFLMKVKNIGSGTLTNLSLVALLPPTSLGTQPLEFNGVELAPGEEYTYSKALLASNAAALTAVVTIPAGQVTGVCQGNTVSTVQSRTASINLTL